MRPRSESLLREAEQRPGCGGAGGRRETGGERERGSGWLINYDRPAVAPFVACVLLIRLMGKKIKRARIFT